MTSDAEIVERLKLMGAEFLERASDVADEDAADAAHNHGVACRGAADCITRLSARVEELERERALLLDPVAVHANMLRGMIAKPSLPSFLHAVGGEALMAIDETVRIASRNEQSPYIDQARSLLSPSTMKE